MAAVLGTSASVLFVLSHIPQIRILLRKDRTALPSAHMFLVQLVSGGIWIAYGIVQNVTTIVLFGIISTTFRVIILSVLYFMKHERTDTPTFFLLGGGVPNERMCHAFSRYLPSWTTIVVIGTDDRSTVSAFRSIGCHAVSGDASMLATASAVWLTNGDTQALMKKLDGVTRDQLRQCATKGAVGGSSAGVSALHQKQCIPFQVATHGRRSKHFSIDDGCCLVLRGKDLVEVIGRVSCDALLSNV